MSQSRFLNVDIRGLALSCSLKERIFNGALNHLTDNVFAFKVSAGKGY